MAYIALLWKARTIENYRLIYEKEKLNSIKTSSSGITKQNFFAKWWNHNFDAKKRLTKTFRKLSPEGSAINNFCVYLSTDETFPNFVLKSVLGFVGGIVLTYLFFMFFVFQLSISLIHATIMSSIIGPMLTLGLAFSYRIRCLVFLLIPQFFSRVGRYTLTCYALVLILTGPATNTLKNSEVLSESMACGQEQIKTNVNQINESMRKPFNTMKGTIKLMIDKIRKIAVKLKEALVKFQRMVITLANILQSSFYWLDSVANTCNEKFGTPYELCIRSLNDAVLDCHAKFDPTYSWICDAARVTDVVCWTVKPLKSFCVAIDFVNRNILKTVRKKLKIFSSRIKTMLYVQVHIHHSYSFSSNASRSASQVAAGIVTEIRNRADPLLTWLSWSSCVTSLFLLLIIFRAKYYQHMFETRSRFDNRYVTKELRDLDFKRLRQGRETVLPLNKREKVKYIKTTSFRLMASEKVHLSRSAVFMVITTFKLMIHIIADYSLYWVLMTIRFHGRFQSPFPAESPDANVHISGSGFVARFVKSLLGSLGLPFAYPISSPVSCLPNPYPPDLQRYGQIGILIILLWFCALFEPYGLRLRHVIMGLYRPERAKARAVWLYNHIQRTRAGFMKFARRKLHREYKYRTEEKYTFRRWLHSHLPCKCLQYLLGTNPDEPHCLLCGTIEYPSDSCTLLVRCETPSCPGTYCNRCFSDIGQLCTICLSPIDYGDLSDVSLEKGSSGESSDTDNDSDDDKGPDDDLEAGRARSPESRNSKNGHGHKAIKKGKWHLFWMQKKTTQDEIPLLRHTNKGNEEEKAKMTNNERILRKAMMIRHNKYCEVSKLLIEGNETALFCQYCEIYNKNIDNCPKDFYKMKKSTNRAFEKNTRDNNDTDLAISRKSNDLNFETDFGKPQQSIKSSKVNLTTKMLRKFRNLRKYASENETKRPKKMCNKKMSSLKIMVDLKNNSSNRKKRRKKRRNSRRKRFRDNISLNISRESKQSTQWSFSSLFEDRKRTNSVNKIRFNRSFNISQKSSMGVRKNIRNNSSIDIHSKLSYFLKSLLRKRDIGCLYSCGDCANVEHYNKVPKNLDSHIMTCSGDYENATAPNIIQDKPEEARVTKNIEKGKELNVNKVDENYKLGQRVGKISNKYSSYWNNAKVYFSPSLKFVNFFKTDDVPLIYQKNNHKRRKKCESYKEIPKPATKMCKHQKDNEATRKYRLSSYLSEQDWIKRRCKETVNKPKDKFHVQDTIVESELDAELQNQKLTEKKDVVLCEQSMQNKKTLKEKLLRKQKTPDTQHYSHIRNEKKVNLAKGDQTLGTSVSCVGQLVTVLSSNSQDNTLNDSCKCIDSRSPNIGLTRSWNYYRSLGHRDWENSDYELVNDVDKENDERKTTNVTVANKSAKVYNQPPLSEQHNEVADESGEKSIVEVTFTDHNESFKDKANRFKTRKCLTKKQTFRKESPFFISINKPKRAIKFMLLRLSDKLKNISNAMHVKESGTYVDKEVTVYPMVKACGCQYLDQVEIQRYQDQATQMFKTANVAQSVSRRLIADASVNTVKDMCTCATQYSALTKDLSTSFKSKSKMSSSNSRSLRNVGTMHRNCYKKMRNTGVQWGFHENSFVTALKAKRAKSNHLKSGSTEKKLDGLVYPSFERKPREVDKGFLFPATIDRNPRGDEKGLLYFPSTKSKPRGVNKGTLFKPIGVDIGLLFPPKIYKKRKGSDKGVNKTHTQATQKKHRDEDQGTPVAYSPFMGRKNLQSKDLAVTCSPVINLKNMENKGSSLAIKTRDYSITSTETISSIRITDDETRTNTTICKLATVHYPDGKLRSKPNRFKVNVITKANQSTATDRKRFCDVSTVTSDWWSPILERRHKNIASEKKEKDHVMPKKVNQKIERRTRKRNRGISTDGRVVAFRSHVQIIPTITEDILSPSRYLLESHKYYNELFLSDFNSPHVLSVSEIQTQQDQERKGSPKSYHSQSRRGHRTKRIEKSFIPRKLSSPRRLNVAQIAHVWKLETKNVMRQPKHRSGVNHNRSKISQRKSYDRAAHASKKADQNLLSRGFMSNDHISLDCHCKSTGTVSSY